jgi:hypothetical protein
MSTNNEGILIALLIVLVVGVALQKGGLDACPHDCTCSRCSKGKFTSLAVGTHPELAAIQARDAALREKRHDPSVRAPDEPPKAAPPKSLEEAQRAAWFEAVSSDGDYNTGTGGGVAMALDSNDSSGPTINYQDALIDLVADERMRAQQANWHSEVAPKSHTALVVDDLEEAAAISAYNGQGLYAFRFGAPSQHNNLFVTEQDAESYAKHATNFSFGQ